MPSLKKSFLWSAVEQIGPQVVTFIVSIFLARLLEPADFGLLGLMALFMALATIFADSGMSLGLIQRKELTKDDETSVFAMNIVAGAVLAILLCLISPLAAWFYKQPILIPLLCVNSLLIVISSFGLVQAALLQRNMQFHITAAIGLTASIISGIIGITMAYLGCGVWSLIGTGISMRLVQTILFWLISKWRPRGKVRLHCIRSIWGFSSNLLYCGLMGVIYQNMYSVVIGKVYSINSLGFYNRANRLRMVPVNIISGIVQRVSFPLFSREQNDKEKLLKRLRKLVRVTLLFSTSALTLLIIAADPLVPLLLTDKWRPSIPLLRILCYAGFSYPINVLYLMSLMAQGYSNLNLRLESLKMVIGVISLLLAYRYGVKALACSVVISTFIGYFISVWYNVKLLRYRWSMQALDILPIFMLSAVAGLAAWQAGLLFIGQPTITLMVQTGVFSIILFLEIFLLRKTLFSEVWQLFIWSLSRLKQLPTKKINSH
jgi:teichuronic acid exporter